MKSLNLKEMEVVEGGGKIPQQVYAACGVLAVTMEFSLINPVWAAFHLSAVAGCALVGGLDAASN